MPAQPLVGRLFIAAPLTDAVRSALWDHLTQALRGRDLPGHVVRPASWHLTLRFLGDTPRDAFEAVRAQMTAAALGAPFDVAFTTLGAFPTPVGARVLWIGTGEGARQLAALAGHAERAAVAAGFPPERRPFAAHLTLSRLRPEADVRTVIAAVPPFTERVTVDEVIIYRSHLGPGGARYEALERVPLAAADRTPRT